MSKNRQRINTLLDGSDSSFLEAIGWGELIDPRESFRADEPSHFYNYRSQYRSELTDRLDGKCLPMYETEQDLAIIRGRSRSLAYVSAVMIGAIESLANYVFGTGFTFKAIQRHDAPQKVDDSKLREVQRVMDDAMTHAKYAGFFDREFHKRSREDGETMVKLKPCSCGYVDLTWREADALTEPVNKAGLYEYLDDLDSGEDGLERSWSFGVFTRKCEPDKPLGYHLQLDPTGNEWEFLTPDRLHHSKRNVYASSKRGVSDYLPVLTDVDREMRLRKNMVETGTVQAAIAWIREHAPGQTKADVQSMMDDVKSGEYTQTFPGGTTKTRQVTSYRGPTVLDIANGLKYSPGPQGSERNQHFMLLAAYALRSIGVRWVFPEYMISGDASNAAYASTIVAESPFVKARQADQVYYKIEQIELWWKVLGVALEAGWLPSWRSIAEMRQYIEIQCSVPDVATRDEQKATEVQLSLVESGLSSEETAASKLGLDLAQERLKGAKRREPPQQPGMVDPRTGATGMKAPFMEATSLLESLVAEDKPKRKIRKKRVK